MSINTATVTDVDGLSLGQGALCDFRPHDFDSSYARYERNGVVCGVLFERMEGLDSARGRLYFYPGYQLPRATRSESEWKRFIFDLEPDEALDMRLDADDGEIRAVYTDDNLGSLWQIAAVIDRYVDVLTSVYPQVVEFVSRKKSLPGREE